MQEIKVKLKAIKEERLDSLLRRELEPALADKTELYGKISNSKIRRLILAAAVQVNNRTVLRPAFVLYPASEVTVLINTEKFFFEKKTDDREFEMTDASILYEDENLIFINKPDKFPVEQTVTGNRSNLHDLLVDFLWRRNPSLRNPPYVGIMHRLDRTTSGVIVFTKTRAINKAVSEIFQSHNLTKEYLAVVELPRGGAAKGQASQFTVEMFMGRVTGKSQQGMWGQVAESRGGQYSKTDFRVLKKITVEGRPCLLLECTLYTGRTHQIRVHLASRGLPILGDELYGGHPAKRIYLHSARLSFTINGVLYDVKEAQGLGLDNSKSNPEQ